ncbi:putative asparagine synthase [Flammula alnicola]|nr:putative asparagine synthase [Flammula alnicola]
MCGITASYVVSPGEITDHATLESQLLSSVSFLSHRGPDSTGIYISKDGRLGLAHARLSIIDVEGGQQPLHDDDGHVHAVVNGELYDYDKLRLELEAKGRIFQTYSDSELVIHLYKVHGFNLVHHLRGEFAYVLYDSRRKVLFAARDRFGIKPLYYTLANGRLLIASEMKALMGLGWKAEWDVQSIREGGDFNDNRTVFKGVYKLPPAHQLIFTHMGQLKIQPYWDQSYSNSQAVETRTVEDIVQGVRERLVDAVRVRLRSDVPLAVALSGGIDSSGIAGIASALLKEKSPCAKIVTFTLSFPDRRDLDEGPIAQRMAESIGAEIHMVTPTEADLVAKFEHTVYHSEMAVHTLHAAGKFILSEHIRKQGYKVVLTGEGADEVHGGYAYLLVDYLRSPDPAGSSLGLSLPSPAELEPMVKAIEGSRPAQDQIPISEMSFDDHQLSRSMVGGISTPRVWATTTTPEKLFHPRILETLEVADPTMAIAEGLRPEAREKMASGNWHSLNSALYTAAHAMLPLLLNQLGDRAEMCSSVEGRQPYLDHKLVEYMNAVPPSLKIKPYKGQNGQWLFTEKWILRQAVKPYITEEIYLRKKDQYNAPITRPKQQGWGPGSEYTPLQVFLSERITRDRVEVLGFLDWKNIKVLLIDYLRSPESPKDGGLDRKARHLLMVAAYIILQEKFSVPAVVF